MLSPTNMTDLSTGLSRAGRKIITGSSTKHKQSLCRHTSSPITCKYSPPSQKEKNIALYTNIGHIIDTTEYLE